MGKAVTLYCTACETGYASRGEVPLSCPSEDCLSPTPNWTTVKPFKPTVDDRQFLKSIKVRSD